MKQFRILAAALLLICMSAGLANAAGFAIYEWSARGNALGGTLVARADDPSAVAFNPAGITQLEGTHFQGGMSAIMPQAEITVTNPYTGNTDTIQGEKSIWTPAHAYLTHQINDKWFFGVGTFSRFGLGTVIDDSFWGRYQGYEEILQTVSFNPNFAYKVNDRFSVAFGVEAMYLDLVYRRMADANAVLAAAGLPVEFNNPETTATDVDSKLDVDSMGLGVNVALHYQMTDKVAVGASYRSQVHQDASGRHTFDISPGAAATLAAVGADVFNSAHVKGSVTLPDMISAGISYKYSDTLDFEFDVVFTRWSTYEDFTVEYDTLDAIGSYQSVSEKNWEDTFRFQFGMEYKATDWATLRCGYVYDQSPIRAGYADYMVPTNDRQLINLGAGFKLSEQSVLDLSYTYLVSESRTFGPRMTEGVLDSETAEGRAHIIGVSFSYAF